MIHHEPLIASHLLEQTRLLVLTMVATATGLRIKENKEVYEGEVIELAPEETENQMGGYGKVISHVIIGLRTVKGSKQLKLDPTIFDSLQKENVQVILQQIPHFIPANPVSYACTCNVQPTA